jgi:hypothetical protein
MHTKRVRNIVFTLFAFWALSSMSSNAYAIQTASSFDFSLGYTSLSLQSLVDNEVTRTRTLSSPTGVQIDYNIALFDYKTVATLSFAQFATSNLGPRPLTRIAIGGSYHFIRMNGQRILLDNQVEAKSWGIEITAGLSYLSISDPDDSTFQFTSSLIDVLPRLLIEVPASPSFLIMVRLGYLKSLAMSGGNSRYNIVYSGFVANVGFKLTTF